MGGFGFREATVFHVRVGAVECDAHGLRVGGIELLDGGDDGAPRRVPSGEQIASRLVRAYALPIGAIDKLGGCGSSRRR